MASCSDVLILKKSNLDLKTCLETFKISPFTLETFLKYRQECINDLLIEHQNDYQAIVTFVIREMFADLLRQVFTIFADGIEEKVVIFQFINRNLFLIISNLRSILKKATFDRPKLTHFWHSTVLASEALKPFSADFSIVLEDIFANKMFEMIKIGIEERLNLIEKIEFEDEIILNNKYELNTTIALNSVIDAINHYRLCPNSELLKHKIIEFINSNTILTENIKTFSNEQILIN